jgi:hypothetical protein
MSFLTTGDNTTPVKDADVEAFEAPCAGTGSETFALVRVSGSGAGATGASATGATDSGSFALVRVSGSEACAEGVGAGAGADCANAPPANAEMASANVVFLNMLIKTPIVPVE